MNHINLHGIFCFSQFLHLPVDVRVLHLITHGSVSHCLSHDKISGLCLSDQIKNTNKTRHKLMSDIDGYCSPYGLLFL